MDNSKRKNSDTRRAAESIIKKLRKDSPVVKHNVYGVYVVVVLAAEAKQVGVFEYLQKNEKDPSVTGSIYIGKSRDGKVNSYHSDTYRNHYSSIAGALKSKQYAAFQVRSITFEGPEARAKAETTEQELLVALATYDLQPEKPGRMRWVNLNKNVVTNLLDEAQISSAVKFGKTKTPLVMTDPVLISPESEAVMSSHGHQLFHVLKTSDNFEEFATHQA